MMTEQKYNGYTNYETWVVNLWFTNDEGSYRYWIEAAKEAKDTADLADRIKTYLEDTKPDLPPGIFLDMVNSCIAKVNAYEVADMFMSEIGEEQD